MTTATPDLDVDLDSLVYGEDDPDITHYVHLDCQEGKELLVAMCGMVLPIEEMLPPDAPAPIPCKPCCEAWLVRKCPSCGK